MILGTYLKIFLHKTFRSLGLNIHRITPTSNSYLQLLQALNLFNIDVVFDIGANTGQFASELRSLGFTLWAIDQEFIDHRDGRTLQINATFFRV
jgi:hypothetical protein